MLTFTERTMKQKEGELTNCQTIKEIVFGTRSNKKLTWLHAFHVRLKAWPFSIFRELLRLSLIAWLRSDVKSSRTCVRRKVSLLDRCQTQIFLAVTGLWGSGEVSLSASKNV